MKSQRLKNKMSVCVCVCLWLIILCNQAIAKEDLYVDFNTIIQENFLGINAVYHAFTYMPESLEQGMTDELRKIELDRVEQSGLHIARTFYRPDWAMGEGVWTEPDWNSTKMKALYAWLADMQERNVDVALNMGWWFARDVIWNRDQHLPSYPDDMQRYVEWVSESLHQIIELRKFTNVKYLIMFTEPGNNYGDIPHGKKNWDYYKEVLRATQTRLVADKRRDLVKIVGPNTTQAPRWIEKAATELNDVIDIYTSHNYNFDSYQKWFDMAVQIREACKATGKPFWIDEYGFQNFDLRKTGAYGNIIAQANAAFLNAGAQSSLIWIFNDQYYPYPLKHITNGDAFLDGKHSWGLFPWLPESKTVRPAWHAFSLLSKLMGGPGTKIYATTGTDTLHVAAVKLPDGTISLLVVNGSEVEQEFDLHLPLFGDKRFSLYHYDPTQLIAQNGENTFTGDVLNGRIPPQGFLVYSTLAEKTAHDLSQYNKDTEGNLAYQKSVTVSSFAPGHPGSNITDGTRLTSWRTDPQLASDEQQGVVIDLEKVYQLREVDVFGGTGKMLADDSCLAENVSVHLSEDAKKWHPVMPTNNVQKTQGGFFSFSFDDRPARFVGLSTKSSSRGSDCFKEIEEVKVYGLLPGSGVR